MKTHFGLLFVSSVLVLAGCGHGNSTTPISEITPTSSKTNDTSRLDDMAQDDPKSAEFAAQVKQFYRALQTKDWPTTYNMRTANFKRDVTKEFYLKDVADDGKRWSLDSYRVLGIEMFGNSHSSFEAAEIIMEFREAGSLSYKCARWKNEGGTWVCDESGISGLALLHSMQVPDWVKD